MGFQGFTGDPGPTGPPGPPGPIGPRGLTGTAGPAGASAIIPFASGVPVTLTTVAGGAPGTIGLIGFGTSAPGAFIPGTINLSDPANFAFSMPRSGLITSVSAYFSTTAALSLAGTSIVVTARLYSSGIPNNTFTPLPGAFVNLTALSGTIPIGTPVSGITNGIAVPVTAQTRLLMVFSASALGVSTINTVWGHAGAGISIN